MKHIFIVLVSFWLFSCNFEFVKEEEPKEDTPKVYYISANFGFYSSRTENDQSLKLNNRTSFFPFLFTIHVTENVPQEAALFDNKRIESFSLIENSTNTIWEYTDAINLIYERSNEFKDSLNNKLKTVTEKNVFLKYKFVQKYYSDSLEFPLPKPTYILETRYSIIDSTFLYSYDSDSVFSYKLNYEITFANHSIKTLFENNWKIEIDNSYYTKEYSRIEMNFPYRQPDSISYTLNSTKINYIINSEARRIYPYKVVFTFQISDNVRSTYEVGF